MRVLIGTDGSDDAIAAASRALPLLAPPDVVTLVCVVEPSGLETAGLESGFGGGIASPDEIAQEQAAAESVARTAVERTASALATEATLETRVEAGTPGPTLCRLAAELPADMVVVGSRGRGAIRRALMGSVSTHVVNNAPCPVVVVRVPG
jgi:nucleotide-binding universal stress UspA family protein